jgi:hypothetical protein
MAYRIVRLMMVAFLLLVPGQGGAETAAAGGNAEMTAEQLDAAMAAAEAAVARREQAAVAPRKAYQDLLARQKKEEEAIQSAPDHNPVWYLSQQGVQTQERWDIQREQAVIPAQIADYNLARAQLSLAGLKRLKALRQLKDAGPAGSPGGAPTPEMKAAFEAQDAEVKACDTYIQAITALHESADLRVARVDALQNRTDLSPAQKAALPQLQDAKATAQKLQALLTQKLAEVRPRRNAHAAELEKLREAMRTPEDRQRQVLMEALMLGALAAGAGGLSDEAPAFEQMGNWGSWCQTANGLRVKTTDAPIGSACTVQQGGLNIGGTIQR